ncbi:MAG: tripartite tricarboxylate transporter substrate-binding protein [Betaproteobacteria bacterium]
MTPRILLAAALMLVAGLAAAQGAGRIIVPYPPGGSLDAMARYLAGKLADATGRSYVVENRSGAAGAIGSAALKGGPTDGTLLLLAPDSNISVYPPTVAKPAYVPLNDFVAIAHSGSYRIALAVNASVPANDLKSFIAWTRAQPGPVGYGTAGAGTNLHFYGVLFTQASGANLVHVPFRGTGPAVVDLVAGHLPSVMLPMAALIPHARAGRIRLLAQTAEDRPANLPDVPSFKEVGFPMLAFAGWYGLFAPAGTPADIVNRYNEIVVGTIRAPETRERMRSRELEPRGMSAAEVQAVVRADTERWAPIIRNSGFKPAAE